MFFDDDEEIVDVTAIIFVAEAVMDEFVKIVEIDVGGELRSNITNGNSSAGWLVVETFAGS